MVANIIIISLLLGIIVSLAWSFIYMMRGKGQGDQTVKALTYRIAIWVVLFLIIIIGLYTGIITPSGSLEKAAIISTQN